MNKTYKDTDLGEALRRKYAETPQLPADFMAKMERRMDAKPVAKTRRLWVWLSAAACILIIIGIGVRYSFEDHQGQSFNRPRSISQPTTVNQSTDHSQSVNRPRSISQSTTVNQSTDHGRSVNRPRSISQPTTVDSNIGLHHASYDLTKETVPYQDPARVDSFIAKLAANYDVKQGELTCSIPTDSNVVNTVYVFPDTKEVDVFGRLLQVACWYSDEAPGYFLNFSHQQFFFQLKDLRQGLHYLWIAERLNGKILLYGSHVPIGTTMSSDCYQEYREQMTHIGSITPKPKDI